MIALAEGVRRALAELKAGHPEITVTEAFNLIDPVVENYEGSMRLFFEGAGLAILVVFLFLRDWRATCVSAVALPLSVIPAFALMYAVGFTLNTVTLLSLSLVVGMLVDWQVLHPVRLDGRRRGVLLARRGPSADAHDGGLPVAGASAARPA